MRQPSAKMWGLLLLCLVVVVAVGNFYSVQAADEDDNSALQPVNEDEIPSANQTHIRISPGRYSKPIWLEVLVGEYELHGGATLIYGSAAGIEEEWLRLEPGLIVEIGEEEVVLGGETYAGGTILEVVAESAADRGAEPDIGSAPPVSQESQPQGTASNPDYEGEVDSVASVAPITLSDLSDGFTMASEDALAALTEGMEQDDSHLENAVLFVNEQEGRFLFGMTFRIVSEKERRNVALGLSDPQIVLDLIADQSLLSEGLSDVEPITHETIGDRSAAASGSTTLDGTPFSVRIALFLRDDLLTTIFLLHLEALEPSLSIIDLANTWDSRIAGDQPDASEMPKGIDAPTMPAVGPDAEVNASALNLRDGPGIAYEVLTTLGGGDLLNVVGEYGDCAWLQVANSDGVLGWVSGAAQYVTLNLPCSEIPSGIVRPRSGLIERYRSMTGQGELVIENEGDGDALIILTTLDDEAVAAAYVRGDDSLTVTGIVDGIYWIYYSRGDDWDDEARRFTQSVQNRRFEDSFDFETDAAEYTIWTITLSSVVGGNADTIAVRPDQFPLPD